MTCIYIMAVAPSLRPADNKWAFISHTTQFFGQNSAYLIRTNSPFNNSGSYYDSWNANNPYFSTLHVRFIGTYIEIHSCTKNDTR